MESERKLFQGDKLEKIFKKYNRIKEILKRETSLSTKNNKISIEEFSSQRDLCKIENILDEDRRV